MLCGIGKQLEKLAGLVLQKPVMENMSGFLLDRILVHNVSPSAEITRVIDKACAVATCTFLASVLLLYRRLVRKWRF